MQAARPAGDSRGMRMRHAERKRVGEGEGGDLGEIHRQGPGPRLFDAAAIARCWCWCWPSCHFSLEIGSAQVQLQDLQYQRERTWSRWSANRPTVLANRGIPISHKSQGLRSIHYFWAQAPGPGRPWVQLRDLLSTSHWPMVSSKLLEVKLRTRQAVISTVDDSLARVC